MPMTYHYQPQLQQPPNPAPAPKTPAPTVKVKTGGSKVIPVTLLAIAIFIVYIGIKGSWQNVLGMFNFTGLNDFLSNPGSTQTIGTSPTQTSPTIKSAPTCPAGSIAVLTAVGWACRKQTAQ